MEDNKLGSVIDAIRKRRSVRKYRQVPVEKEKIIDIIEAARLAPSASNRQPWRFVTVSDTQLKDKVVKESLGVINQWAL
jgi:nitroreductase